MEKFSDISSADDSDKESHSNSEVLKLFDSEDEFDKSFSGFEKEPTNDPSNTTANVKPLKSRRSRGEDSGPGKGPGKNLKKKAPAKRKSSDNLPTIKKKAKKVDENNNTNAMLTDLLSKFLESSNLLSQNINSIPGTSKSGDCSEVQGQEYNDGDEESMVALDELFPEDNVDNHTFVTEKSDFDLPKIFDDQTRFSDAVSDSLADFVNSACTKKADVAAFIEGNQIPSNCKSLVPPLINSEIWSFLYSNIQQRDKSLQEVQKILGLSIVPIIKLAEMMKTGQIDFSKAKTWITQAMALACHSFFELNIKRRYFIRPYVSKKFQQLCSASYPIEDQLFPKDVSKKMKEITEASQINKQVRPSKNYRGQPYGRGRGQGYSRDNWFPQGSQSQRGGRGSRRSRGQMRGRYHN